MVVLGQQQQEHVLEAEQLGEAAEELVQDRLQQLGAVDGAQQVRDLHDEQGLVLVELVPGGEGDQALEKDEHGLL